jgi:peptidoglycan glycosyltransferase
MSSQLNRLSAAFMAAFVLVVGATGYWAFVRADDLITRGDNPRRILLERRVPRGTIFDRNGQVLAEAAGAPGEFTRHYPYPPLSSLLGYVSPLYGITGLEAAYDPILHGDNGYDVLELWQLETMLGSPPPGRAVRLTLDLALQQAADDALGERAGAVAALNAATGEILALASHPIFDANTLDDTWSSLVDDPQSPLLNRATLGLYQPGGALAPAILARALDAGVAALDQAASAETLAFGGQEVACVVPDSGALTLADALRAGCPAPLADLGASLGPEGLRALFQNLRLYEPPAIGLPAGAASRDAGIADATLAALGQDRLAISPLQLALVTAAIVEHGVMPAPRLVLATEGRDGEWQEVPPAAEMATALAGSAADAAAEWLGDGFAAQAISGEGGGQGLALAWYAGVARAETGQYVVVVLLEDGEVEAAEAIGQAVLSAVGP